MRKILSVFVMLLMICKLSLSQSANRIEAIRWVQEADNLLKIGDIVNAIFSYSNATITDATYAEAFIKRALLHEKIGNYSQASNDLTVAL